MGIVMICLSGLIDCMSTKGDVIKRSEWTYQSLIRFNYPPNNKNIATLIECGGAHVIMPMF